MKENTQVQLKAIGNTISAKKAAIAKQSGESFEKWYKRSGVSPRVCHKIERGESITLANFLQILSALDIDLALDAKIGGSLKGE